MRLSNRNIPAVAAASLFIAATLSGCRGDVAWSRSKAIPPDGWSAENPIDFNLDPAAYQPPQKNRFAEMTKRAVGDTLPRILGKYHASLSLRYLKDCNVDTLRVVVSIESLDASETTDTIAFPLYANGSPVGTGRLGIFESTVALPYPFKVSNGTTISIAPIQYADSISGLSDITLLLKH